MVAILEDDAGRIREMGAWPAAGLPGVQGIFFENAAEMKEWLGQRIGDTVLISLDHDLPLRDRDGRPVDCGTGRQVADFLASFPPTCPVIIHSSNNHCAPGMFYTLRDAGWPVSRIYPVDDLAWVRRDWGARIEQYVRDGWITV